MGRDRDTIVHVYFMDERMNGNVRRGHEHSFLEPEDVIEFIRNHLIAKKVRIIIGVGKMLIDKSLHSEDIVGVFEQSEYVDFLGTRYFHPWQDAYGGLFGSAHGCSSIFGRIMIADADNIQVQFLTSPCYPER